MILSKKVFAYRLSPFVARIHSVLGGQALIAWSVKLYKRPAPSRLFEENRSSYRFSETSRHTCNTLALLLHHGSQAPKMHHSWEYTHCRSVQQMAISGRH